MHKYTTKILIIDDHPIVRMGVSNLIQREQDMEVCGEYDGSQNISALIEQHQPDVLILDISLQHDDGITITRALRQAGSNLPVIMLSMHESKVYISRAMRAGANGYVVKSESSEQLVTAIREVRQGRGFVRGESSDDILQSMAVKQSHATDSPLILLSDRERQIFELIGRGYSTLEIAERIKIRPKTVETYRSRVKSKLELDSPHKLSLAAIEWATRHGLTAPAV